MRKLAFKVLSYATILLVLLTFVSYFVPSEDVVKITNVGVMRVDDASTSAEDPKTTRDVYEIYADSLAGGAAQLFYNQDAPWYLKFDSGTTQSMASSIASDKSIAAVNHVGWRIPILSMVPNAIGVKRVAEGYQPFPLQIVVFAMLTIILLGCRFVIKRRLKRMQMRIEAQRAADAAERARLEEERLRSASAGSAQFESLLRGENN